MSRKRKSPSNSPAPKAHAGEMRPSAAQAPPYRPLPVRLPSLDPSLCRAVAQAQKELRKYENRIHKQETARKNRDHYKQAGLRDGVRSKGHRYLVSGMHNRVQNVQYQDIRPGIPDRGKMRLSGLLSFLHSPDVLAIRARVCSSRRARRRALFSLRRAGKGASGHRAPRWAASSYVRCG